MAIGSKSVNPVNPNHQEYGKTGVHHEAIGSDGHEEAAGTDGKESNEAFGRRPSNKEKKVGFDSGVANRSLGFPVFVHFIM